MMTVAPQASHRHSDKDVTMVPGADCIADSAGGLTFDITDPGPGAAAGDTHLVLRHRDGVREVRLPLTPAADGRLRAALPSSVELPEGRWDAYAQVADGEPQRLAPGLNDLRSLVDRVPSGARGHVAVRIPYGTKHGNLSVRSWLRAPHAEAGELRIGKAELAVRGQVYGVELSPDAYAELRRRAEPETVVRAEVTLDQARFGLTVAYSELTEGVWDLWLRPAGETGPRVRIARLLDDIADKKPIFSYPKVTVETVYGPAEAGPYYTSDNDLSVTVTSVGSPQ
ncbi:FixH family protein [Streptomyces phaeochromogenes]|uniref:hypothetical protein n=1 Tax=Streptomyces phaeochromogenes TaxID=1923 RepID=UPI0022505DEE|nr:hypothetical protein [Streptomyces phaeochromogenes]MCX5597917.1 FixH family protein [Streptomyces phaeochromogenes]WSJ04357.1 FixH family protein [Streptomyces phaeochromogenes]